MQLMIYSVPPKVGSCGESCAILLTFARDNVGALCVAHVNSKVLTMLADQSFNLAALAYFLVTWMSYGRYAKTRAKRGVKPSLSRAMRRHRILWAQRMLDRENRIIDASLLANQERVVAFFASATLIIVAAVLTALSRSEELQTLAGHISPAGAISVQQIELKLLVLLLIFVYAFFKITWALRQYGFASVLVGSAPMPDEPIGAQARERFAFNLARLMDAAGHDNNSCLRAYYFALAVVFWFAGDLAFIVATTGVVGVLANREFRSNTVAKILRAEVTYAASQALSGE